MCGHSPKEHRSKNCIFRILAKKSGRFKRIFSSSKSEKCQYGIGIKQKDAYAFDQHSDLRKSEVYTNSFLFCANQSTHSKLIIALKQNIPKQSTKQTPSSTNLSKPSLFLRHPWNVWPLPTCNFIFYTYSFLNFFLSSPHFLPSFFPFSSLPLQHKQKTKTK